jgi:hypothetical protein
MWVPAPRAVVAPSAAGVEHRVLAMPEDLDRFAAPPVFICGCARSGTTWTFDLFERHPEVHAICESWILSQTHGVTGVLTQPYWDTAERAVWQQRVDMPFGAVQLLPYEEMVRDVGALVARWMVRTANDQHRYLVAKEPLDVRATAILFPKARFIHVVRDGRNVALSMRRASESWDPTMGVGLPMEFRAEAWRRQVENVRAHREFLGERYLEIRYEQMQADVVSAMQTLFDFSEIPYSDAVLAQIRANTDLESYDETVQRSGFRGGGRNRSWREELTAREVIAFDRVAGDLLAELGYECGPQRLSSKLLPLARRRAAGPAGR